MVVPLNPGQGVRWCLCVIHNQAINSKKKYIRWEKDILISNYSRDKDTEDWDESITCEKSAVALANVDLFLWFRSLPYLQCEIMKGFYILGLSQTEIAKRLNLSQQHVSRLKNKALLNLREQIFREAP